MPPAAGGVPPCECAIDSVAFLGGETEAQVDVDGTAVIVASGLICPDTEWSFELDWTGDTTPEVEQQGASAWSITSAEGGVLTITPSAVCNGQSLSFDPLTLTFGTCTASATADNGWIEGCVAFESCPTFTSISGATLTIGVDEYTLVVDGDCISYSASQDPQPDPIAGDPGTYEGTLTITDASGTTEVPITVEIIVS
jgi:hypothetical protein